MRVLLVSANREHLPDPIFPLLILAVALKLTDIAIMHIETALIAPFANI